MRQQCVVNCSRKLYTQSAFFRANKMISDNNTTLTKRSNTTAVCHCYFNLSVKEVGWKEVADFWQIPKISDRWDNGC